jgi:hypothetical protein
VKRLAVGVIFLVSVSLHPIPIASAQSVENCRIKASDRQYVSLGFPIAQERLASLTKPKILVIPFKLKDNPNYIFTTQYKRNYEAAASNIKSLSKGKSSPEFVLLQPVLTEFTNNTMNTLKTNQNSANQNKDESKSTWGFVRKFIADNDDRIDFTGINAVILEGSSNSPNSYMAEAMMMKEGPGDPYYRPIETGEGKIYNAVLLDKHPGTDIITHETMHLYGLTDLYGSTKGPGDLSLMDGGRERSLLTYEKWVLGWLQDTEVQCSDDQFKDSILRIVFDYSKDEQLLILKTLSETHYIIETSMVDGVYKKLAFYSLNNEKRPPIELFGSSYQALGLISTYAIGTKLVSPDYTLLVSDINNFSLILDLVPDSLTQSPEFNSLVKESEVNRRKYQVQIEAKAKAAADKAAASKKTTITCTKGKLTKKVTAIKPKCPSGYKNK